MHYFFYLAVLFFGITSSFASDNTLVFNNSSGNLSLVQTPEFEETINGYKRLIKMGDSHTTEEGAPELPIFSTFYQIDPDKIYDFELEIHDSYIIENIKIFPYQGATNFESNQVSIVDEDIYNSFNLYPHKNLIVSDRIQGRGIEFVNIQVVPFKYSPKSQRLEVYTDISVIAVELGPNQENLLVQNKRSKIFDKMYSNFIANFTSSDMPDDYQAQSILYIAGGNWIENGYVQDLLLWRHKQGYIVNAVSTSEIGASNGNENIIKNYIQEAYDTWENPPEIVGLIGDTDVIDCFYQAWGSGGWNSYNGSTDSDYGQLAGGDLIPEVLVGRISGQGTSTMENVINKTIQYEKALYVNDDWFMNAALVGDPSQSGNSTIFTSQYIENIMTNHGMTNAQGYYVENGITNWLVDKFNEGILYYNYRGIYGDDGTDFGQLSNQINNGYNTPFATVMTCGTGDFDEGNSQTEEFVKYGSVSNPKGAVAAIGLATTGTHTAYNNILNMGIYDGIFVQDLWYAGAAEASGDLAMIATYPSNPGYATEAFTGWSNLIGDPALHLWSDIPNDFAVDHLDIIPLGTTALSLIVYDENGNTVNGARVALLMGDDDIFTVGETDQFGQIDFSWDYVGTGTIYITVMKQNYRPYEGEIQITTISNFAVAAVNQMIEVESGQYNNFNIRFQNFANSNAEGITVELSSPSDYIVIDSPITTIDFIEPGVEIEKNYSLYIDETVFYSDEISLSILISDQHGNYIENKLPLQVSGPYLNISDYYGDIYPGSITNFSINVENIGNRVVENYTISIEEDHDMVDIISPRIEINDLYEGENIYIDGYEIHIDPNMINGSIIPLDVIIEGFDGSSRVKTINVMAGEVRETDPLGPDEYGYYIYDTYDIDYDIAPSYDWIEIAEGLGDQLNLNDYGNGNFSGSYTYSSEVIDLPFTFTFYGIDYEQIVVNTNGWISFGDFKMYSFRNYHIPGAGGPSPMVAAFWDDLKTGSGGYVHYFSSDEKVIIQWDDMRTYDNNNRETFQVILYNKEFLTPTITGDSEIKIQYQEFNNTSDGYYPNGGTPTHGCYSTVGIENHLGDIGLEYTFNNNYPQAASRLEDGSAILITTGRAPRVNISIENVDLVNGLLDIFVDSQEEISGFQFELLGIDVLEVLGGMAEANEFFLSSSMSSILGFSISGTTIPVGSGLLAQVSFSNYEGAGICFGTDPVNNVISNTFGYFLETNWGDCFYQDSLVGDLNSDGVIDILDLVGLANLILDNEFLLNGDVNADGALDILDIVSMINIILSQ